MNYRLPALLLHAILPAWFVALMIIGPVFPDIYMYGNSLLLFCLLCGVVFLPKERTFLAGCAVIPLAIIVSLTLSPLPLSIRSLLVYGTFFSVGLSFTREYLYIKLHLFTLPPIHHIIFCSAIGLLIGVFIAQLSMIVGTAVVDASFLQMNMVQILLVLPVVAVGEEIIYRRVIQNESEKIVPRFVSVVVTSILYAVLFFPLGPLPVFIGYMLSLFLGVVYLLSRRILLTSITSLGIKTGFIAGLLIFQGSLLIR